MGLECQKFLRNLAMKMSENCEERYENIICWLRTRISMEITRSSLLCLRGSRVPFRSYDLDDIGLDNALSGVFWILNCRPLGPHPCVLFFLWHSICRAFSDSHIYGFLLFCFQFEFSFDVTWNVICPLFSVLWVFAYLHYFV